MKNQRRNTYTKIGLKMENMTKTETKNTVVEKLGLENYDEK